MNEEEFDIYALHGVTHTTNNFKSAILFIQALTNCDTEDDLEIEESIPGKLTNVFCGNIRVAVIHKHNKVTAESIAQLHGIDFNNWLTENRNKFNKIHQVTDKFLGQFHIPLSFYDEIYNYIKVWEDGRYIQTQNER